MFLSLTVGQGGERETEKTDHYSFNIINILRSSYGVSTEMLTFFTLYEKELISELTFNMVMKILSKNVDYT